MNANEPVAWMNKRGSVVPNDLKENEKENALNFNDYDIPLYTHPAKTLTDEEIGQIYKDVKADSLFEQTFPYRFAHAIQIALGVKEPLQLNSGLGGIALRKAQEK